MTWAPVWATQAVAAVGVISILSAAVPASASTLSTLTELLPGFAPEAARSATAAVGMVLLIVAGGLRRRKRRAWVLGVVLAGSAAVLHVVKGFDLEEAAFSLAVLGLLFATRQAFPGISDPRSRRHTTTVFLVSSSIATIAGSALVLLDPDARVGQPGFVAVFEHVALGLVGFQGPLTFTPERAGEVSVTLALLGAMVVAATLASLLRPAGGPQRLSTEDEGSLRDLLARHGGRDSLGYFALRRDKSVMFSTSRKAAVAYRVIGGVSLASGDPIGDPEAWPGAIEGWLSEARRYAWVPGVLAASELGAEAYHRSGLDALEFGDEAVLEVQDFTLDGRAMRTVRQAVSRVRRLGYSCEVTAVSGLDRAQLAEVRDAAEGWRDGATERGFAMALGRLGDPADTGCVLVRARDESGDLSAFLHLVPWGGEGLSLDLMRRAPTIENGVMELMVVDLLAAAPALGAKRVSLNFAVFRAVFERGSRLGAGPVLRLWRRLLLTASRFWQIESLYRANAKYRPVWEPRFLCFRSAAELPRITICALEAEAFLVRPRLPGLRAR